MEAKKSKAQRQAEKATRIQRWDKLVKEGKVKPLDQTVPISEDTLRRLNRGARKAADIIETYCLGNAIDLWIELCDAKLLQELMANLEVICEFYRMAQSRCIVLPIGTASKRELDGIGDQGPGKS